MEITLNHTIVPSKNNIVSESQQLNKLVSIYS